MRLSIRRRAAILARYDASSNNRFVVQLAYRRLGDSPTMQFEENVKILEITGVGQ